MRILYQWIGDGSQRIRENYNASDSRSLHITGAAGAFCMLLGLGKIISGALSLSVFACMNGCYTLGMTAARYCALAGTVRSTEESVFLLPSCRRRHGSRQPVVCCIFPLDNPPSENSQLWKDHGYHHCNDHLYGDRCQCMGRNKIPEVPFPSASRAEDYQPGDFADLAGADPVSDSCVCR